jgi:short-subunit dehydrogenase
MADDFSTRYGPWALVLGGSNGIGASFARQIADRGVNVVLVARNPGSLEAAAADIAAAAGVETRALAVDLTADDMLDQLAAGTDDVDVGLVVYNAGADHAGYFLDRPASDADFTVRLNCVGPTVVARHFGERLTARRRGGMILVSSLAAICGQAGTTVYAASKAFDQLLAEGLWFEWAPLGVDVLCLLAGITDTPNFRSTGANVDYENFPGMTSDDVAREGLENLANGPTWIAGEENRSMYEMMRPVARRDAVTAISRMVVEMYALGEPGS